jgi:polyhydroxyalkanoate synthesis regulator phasin
MNTQSTTDQVKSKANGKFNEVAAVASQFDTDKIVAKGEEFLDMAQETVTDLINQAPKLAKTYSSKAIKWAKANPAQAAVIGALVAYIFAPKFLGKKNA